MIKALVASSIESLVPLIAGLVFSAKLFKQRDRKVYFLGPILIIFGVLLFIRPLFHTSSRSFLNQTILKETISYEDLVGTWKSVLSEPKLNKELIYIFTFTPGGACTLDYNNKDLTFNVDSKYFYDMKCFFRDGRLFYRPVVIK